MTEKRREAGARRAGRSLASPAPSHPERHHDPWSIGPSDSDSFSCFHSLLSLSHSLIFISLFHSPSASLPRPISLVVPSADPPHSPVSPFHHLWGPLVASVNHSSVDHSLNHHSHLISQLLVPCLVPSPPWAWFFPFSSSLCLISAAAIPDQRARQLLYHLQHPCAIHCHRSRHRDALLRL